MSNPKNCCKKFWFTYRLITIIKKLSIWHCYIILLHFLLLISISKTNFITLTKNKLGIKTTSNPFLQDMRIFHYRMDASVSNRAVIFLGDSHTQSLATEAIAPYSVNYGIGGQTVEQLLETIAGYHSLKRAKIIFLAIGTNDLNKLVQNSWATKFEQLLAALPPHIPLVWSSIMPMQHIMVSSQNIIEANHVIKTLCSQRQNCVYVDTWQFFTDTNGQMIKRYFLEDGIHLSPEGYHLWIEALQHAMHNITD